MFTQPEQEPGIAQVVVLPGFIATTLCVQFRIPILIRDRLPLLFFLTADSETSDAADSYYDVLMCGSCQKTFALGEIVKFIQHKVLQCNKENYGQCYTQGEWSAKDMQL